MSSVEDALIEPVAVQEVFVDGFMNFEVKDAVLTCVGYRTHRGVKVATLRIVMPVANLGDAIARACAAAADLQIDPGIMPPMVPKMLS